MKVRDVLSLMSELVDPDDCWYDHDGNCQTHNLEPDPCPHERAKALLASVALWEER